MGILPAGISETLAYIKTNIPVTFVLVPALHCVTGQ